MSYLSDLAAGTWVWCDYTNQEARTADGFCQFCGKTDHTPMNADEFEAPEADPAEADPAMRFWVKIKAYGMWGAPTYYATYEEALAVIDAVPNPAVAVSIETGMVSRNMEAVAAGVELDAPSSDTCPIHGAGCEAWA